MLPIKIHFPRWCNVAVRKFLTGLGQLKLLWKAWDLRSLILVSLGFQVFLILFAPFRKKMTNFLIVSTIWLAYLLADYVAVQAIGLIPNYSLTHGSTAPHPDLLAFWAPFLLVHPDGPDPITALALEDNELWLRTVLHFFTYLSAIGRVFFLSLLTNLLFFPTMLMFFAGFFKYLKRTLSMYYARSTQFRESVQQGLAAHNHVVWEHNSSPTLCHREASIPVVESRTDIQPDNELEWLTNNVQPVKKAFEFYKKFKGLYVDMAVTLHEEDYNIGSLFNHKLMTAEKAFMVLEMELNFAYEVFYTKMIVIHKKLGITIRCSSFIFQVLSLLLWILFIDKQAFLRYDIWITYTLLGGAVVIDFIAFLMVVLSDWRVAMIKDMSKI